MSAQARARRTRLDTKAETRPGDPERARVSERALEITIGLRTLVVAALFVGLVAAVVSIKETLRPGLPRRLSRARVRAAGAGAHAPHEPQPRQGRRGHDPWRRRRGSRRAGCCSCRSSARCATSCMPCPTSWPSSVSPTSFPFSATRASARTPRRARTRSQRGCPMRSPRSSESQGTPSSVLLGVSTLFFLTLFLMIDMPRLRRGLGSVLMPDDADRWLPVWERITADGLPLGAGRFRRWRSSPGPMQGGTACLLGSSHWLGLAVIAGALDLIPMVGATIAGFILVPTSSRRRG